MELVYTHAESAIKQPELEVGVTTVYFRRNFKQVERLPRMEGEEPELIWTYEEAAVSKDQALYILAEQNSELSQVIADEDAINVDHEYRLTLLELGLTDF